MPRFAAPSATTPPTAAARFEIYPSNANTSTAFPGITTRADADSPSCLDDLRALGPVLGKPDGPILLDCKVNADVAAPFMGEFAEFEARQHG